MKKEPKQGDLRNSAIGMSIVGADRYKNFFDISFRRYLDALAQRDAGKGGRSESAPKTCEEANANLEPWVIENRVKIQAMFSLLDELI